MYSIPNNWDLVAFKFSIDCQKMSKYAILWIFPQLVDIENIEIFHVKALNGIAPLKSDWYQASNPLKICSLHTPNGRRLSLENWLKSDSSLISLISLKSGDFIIQVHQTV